MEIRQVVLSLDYGKPQVLEVSKKVVLIDTQDWLDDTLDKITSMMTKLTAPGSSQNRVFKPKIYQEKRRGQVRNHYNQIDTKIGIDQTVTIGDWHIEVELSEDKIIEEGPGMTKIQLEEHKITGVRILIEIELDALSVGSMIILPKTVWIYQKQKQSSQSRYSRCLI